MNRTLARHVWALTALIYAEKREKGGRSGSVPDSAVCALSHLFLEVFSAKWAPKAELDITSVGLRPKPH